MGLHFEFSEHIDASPERVFDALTDTGAFEAFIDGEATIERLDDGPMKVGSEWKETRKMFGKDATEYFEVVELDKPRRVGLFVDGTRGSSGRGEYHYVYKLEPSGGGTHLVLDARMEDMGILGAIFGRLFSGSFKKAIKKDIDGLKDYLENDESGESA
jgi:carbon monoxide dehydrogenase subunit G